MLCSRLLYLWEAATVRRIVLWKRGRRRWWRVWQCSLYPGPRQERPRTEGRWGSHSAPKLWRVPHPLMSIAGWLWALRRFSPWQTCTLFLVKFITEVQAGLMLRSSHESETPSCWSRVPASVLLLLLLLPWKSHSNWINGLLNWPDWECCCPFDS